MAERAQRPDPGRFERESDEHRVLAPDMVRHPAEERPGDPFSTRSIVSANVSAGSVMPIRLTGTLSIWKSRAIGASCAVAINPPAPTSTNITYITQKTGLRTISHGV